MIRMLEYGARELLDSDVQVYNGSPNTNLGCFERISFVSAIEL